MCWMLLLLQEASVAVVHYIGFLITRLIMICTPERAGPSTRSPSRGCAKQARLTVYLVLISLTSRYLFVGIHYR